MTIHWKIPRQVSGAFWPVLSRVHYANIGQDWLNNNGIEFVSKKGNVPNLPQARPLDQFWAICRRHYHKRSKVCQTHWNFKKVWTNISTTVAESHGQALMAGVRTKLRKIGRKGVYGLHEWSYLLSTYWSLLVSNLINLTYLIFQINELLYLCGTNRLIQYHLIVDSRLCFHLGREI